MPISIPLTKIPHLHTEKPCVNVITRLLDEVYIYIAHRDITEEQEFTL